MDYGEESGAGTEIVGYSNDGYVTQRSHLRLSAMNCHGESGGGKRG